MKLLDAGFQMKKGWERLAQEKKRWNKPFPASIQSSHLPEGGTAISYDWIWRWSPQSPCNQNKTNPKHKHEDSKDRELVVEING